MSSVITRKSVIALSMQIIICSSPCKSGRVRSWTIVVVEVRRHVLAENTGISLVADLLDV